MKTHKPYGLIFLLFLFLYINVNGNIILIHNNTMNISNYTGEVNNTIIFEALAPNSVAQDIINNGYTKWDFGDLVETDYGDNKVVNHTYTFPFAYPVAWCGYLNNTGYSKALTYNWIIIGNIYNTTYIFNGSPSNSKTNWEVLYNSTNNTVIIKYYSESPINVKFLGLSVDTTPVDINVDKTEIVEGDSVKFNYSINRNIIFNVWCFGDGTFSFEKSPTHIYTKPGIYYPRVLVIDNFGRVMVGYLDSGIKVNRPRGGYFEPIRNENYVMNESGAVNVEDEYAMAYRVNEPIYIKPKDAEDYTKIFLFFGDGSETSYKLYNSNYGREHVYKFPFIYPICWMDVDRWGDYSIASSATLDYLVVGDVGDTTYKIIPTTINENTFFKSYDKDNRIVELWSKVISSPIELKLKQKTHYDVVVKAEETNGGIKYSYEYPYSKPVLVFWSFGDGTYSLDNSPTHIYPNNDVDYQAHVMIIDENGIVSVGFGPVIKNNKIISSMLWINPTIVKVGEPFNVIYKYPKNYIGGYLEIYLLDYTKNNILLDELYYIGYSGLICQYAEKYVSYVTSFENLTYKINREGIYYIEGYDPKVYFLPRQVKVINNHNPVAVLYIYPNPASYRDSVVFNPLNSYDPDANRELSDGSGYIISPDEPPAKIYGFNLTVYNSSGDIVWNYSSNELKIIYHKFPIGNYTAILTVWDGFGAIGTTTEKFSVINLPPKADFTYTPIYPNYNDNITFNALSSYDPDGKIVEYIWDFGDGTKITTTNPIITHVYNKPGTYIVTLTVVDNLNATSTIKKTITVYYLKADFTYSPLYPKVNEVVNFYDNSTSNPGNIVKYIWDFGDGSTSTEKNPTHIYKNIGYYTVTLTVWNDLGVKSSISKTIFVRGNTNYPPIAKFNFTINGLNVTFDASSSYDIDGKIVEYIWDFGDGTKITTTNPIITHVYNKPGTYIVTLTVVDNDNNRDSTTKFITIVQESKSIPVPIYVKILIILSTSIALIYIIRGVK
ncbi:PKD domain-containing protein [Methanocaldococcus indicus]|uniref:PKD domain-containing protein n=1 Tax=Methanocaldococcus indicus TaxID=213231 RepID=UPI003C6D3F08